jgi:alkylation response protein AidB-like acyl-CoA dehydrogenase
MRWELSEEQVLFRDALDGWLRKHCSSSSLRGWLETGNPQAYEAALVADAWLGVGTPEQLGGQGGGLVELALAGEAFGRYAAPSSAWLATVLASPALAGMSDLARAVMNKGEFIALAVPATGPVDEAHALALDGCRLSGHVSGVLAADRASHLIAPVRIGDATAFALVDRADANVVPRTLLDRSRSVADVTFDSAPVAVLDMDANTILADAALRSAILVAADALGAMDRMLSMAVDYSKQRHQFGVPIGSFQAVKHAAATVLVSVEAARSITYFAAASVDQGHPERAIHAAVAKAQVTAEAARAADSALTLHGAIGYTWEYDLHLYYKRAMLDRPLFGSPETWNERVAAALPLQV